MRCERAAARDTRCWANTHARGDRRVRRLESDEHCARKHRRLSATGSPPSCPSWRCAGRPNPRRSRGCWSSTSRSPSSWGSTRTGYAAPTVLGCSPEPWCPRAPILLLRAMRDISSAAGCRVSAMAGRCCSVNSSTPKDSCATSISRVPAARRSPAAATGWPPSAPCFASTSSAKRCTHSASRRRARCPLSPPDVPCSARRSSDGAVLARVAASHLRVGSFQYVSAAGELDVLRRLADHAIARHYPAAADADNPYLALLESVIGAQAELVAQWMLVGFIHGVMNTDNMTISGQTIDYGPCAFMDAFDPKTVFSSIDSYGRYAYGNQPVGRRLEPRPVRRNAAPADRRRSGSRDRDRHGVIAGLRAAVRRRVDGGNAGQTRPARRCRRHACR